MKTEPCTLKTKSLPQLNVTQIQNWKCEFNNLFHNLLIERLKQIYIIHSFAYIISNFTNTPQIANFLYSQLQPFNYIQIDKFILISCDKGSDTYTNNLIIIPTKCHLQYR